MCRSAAPISRPTPQRAEMPMATRQNTHPRSRVSAHHENPPHSPTSKTERELLGVNVVTGLAIGPAAVIALLLAAPLLRPLAKAAIKGSPFDMMRVRK